jgi:hypothetical protein
VISFLFLKAVWKNIEGKNAYKFQGYLAHDAQSCRDYHSVDIPSSQDGTSILEGELFVRLPPIKRAS